MKDSKDLKYTIIEELIGKTFNVVINYNDEELIFRSEEDQSYHFYHNQDCCEDVRIDDICGELKDLIGSPILQAEEAYKSCEGESGYESVTWTFYRFKTIKGYVTVRWCGSSNGYYSESVSFDKVS